MRGLHVPTLNPWREKREHATRNTHALFFVLSACLAYFSYGKAFADTSDCVPPSITQPTDNRRDFYINMASFQQFAYDENGTLGHFSTDEIIGAVLQAAEQWNHSAAGREFVYKGIDNSKLVGGSQAGVPYGVIRAGVYNSNTNSLSMKFGGATAQFHTQGFSIEIAGRTNQGNIRRWYVGDPNNPPSSNGSDLVGFLVHEFGHITGQYHPTVGGVMNSNNQRELYEVDIDCAEFFYSGTNRGLTSVDWEFTNGNWSATLPFLNIWSASSGVSRGGTQYGSFEFRGVKMGYDGLYAERYSTGNLYLGSRYSFLPHPPVRAHRYELDAPYRDLILALSRDSINYGNQGDEYFVVKAFTSANGFESSVTSIHNLQHCTSYSSSLYGACYGSSDVRTVRRPAIAFDDEVQKSVYAWTHSDRSDFSLNNDVLISIGSYEGSHFNSTVLARAVDIGVKSEVAPGLACDTNQATHSGYDCLLAFVDPSDVKNSIRLLPFYSVSGVGSYWPITLVSPHLMSSSGWHRTSSPIALFRHDGKWWLAFKLALATGGGGLRLYSSPTGASDSWSLESSTLPYTANGGTALGGWIQENHVFSTY